MNAFVVQIPTSVLQDWVIPLLKISDLVRLDSAVLNHNERLLFISQLQGACLRTDYLLIDNQVALWLVKRHIHVTSLGLSDKVTDLQTNHLGNFNCRIVTKQDAIYFIQACKNVQALGLVNFCYGGKLIESILGAYV